MEGRRCSAVRRRVIVQPHDHLQYEGGPVLEGHHGLSPAQPRAARNLEQRQDLLGRTASVQQKALELFDRASTACFGDVGWHRDDRATYLKFRPRIQLDVMVDGDPPLLNKYSVISVRGATNEAGGKAFADWVVGPQGRALITNFGVAQYGQPLFFVRQP